MRGKKFIAWILVLLFLIPAGVYAAPINSGRSVSSGIYYAPAKIYNGRIDNTVYIAAEYRNLISDTIRLKKNERGYELSFLIGSYNGLQFLQIVRPEYTEEIINNSNGGTLNKTLPLGEFNIPENWTLPRYTTKSVDADKFYFTDQEVEKKVFNEAMDIGMITVQIEDISLPLIVRSSPTITKSGKYPNMLTNSIISIDIEDIFSIEEMSGNTALECLWNGYTDQPTKDLAYRYGTSINGDTVFDKGFDNDAINVQQSDAGITVKVPLKELEGDDHFEKIEVAASRPPQDTDESLEKDYYKLNDYWANYTDAVIEDNSLVLTYSTLEEAALGKIVRITTTADKNFNLNKKEADKKYHYATAYIKTMGEKNIQQIYNDESTGASVQYWSKDYGDGSTVSISEGNQYFSEGTLKSYQTFASASNCYTVKALDKNGEKKTGNFDVKITIPIPADWDLSRLMYGWANEKTSADPVSCSSILDEKNRTITISSADGDFLNSTFFIYDAGEAQDLSALENGIYSVDVSIMNATKTLVPSACNEGFSLYKAYIEKSDEKTEIYMISGGVHFDTMYGYCSNIFTGNIDEDSKVEAEYLAYQLDADTGWTEWETDKASYSAHHSAKIRMELNNAYTEEGTRQYCYLVGFYVPMMDTLQGGLPGSGAMRKPALLRVTNAEKVDENPLKSYENSAAMGEIDNLEYYIATEDGLSQEKKDTLTELFTEAKAEVESWTEAKDSETIENLIRLLKEAREVDPLKEGVYRIPLADNSTVKGISVTAMVKEGKLTLSLTKKNGGTFDAVQYKGLFGDWQTAELSEDQKTVSYTVGYTEEALPLSVDGTEGLLALNFDEAMLTSADFTVLDEAIAAAEEKLENEDLWTASSYSALQAETELAQKLRENWSADQYTVTAQANSLYAAINGLKERADLRELKNELTNALTLASDTAYTAESRNALKTLATELRGKIRDEADVSREDAEAYQLQLQEAVQNLVKDDGSDDDDDGKDDTGKTNALASFVKDYKEWYPESDYTKDSWTEFSAALSKAEELSKQELTDAAYETAIEELMEARAKLVRISNDADERTALAEDMADMQEVDKEIYESYLSLIGYKSWIASIKSANEAVLGTILLADGQAVLLDASMKAQLQALSAELNKEAAADYEDYDSDVENIMAVSEDDFLTASDSDAEQISLASLFDDYDYGTYEVDYDVVQYMYTDKLSMANDTFDKGTDPGTMIHRPDGTWMLYMNLSDKNFGGKTGRSQYIKRITRYNEDMEAQTYEVLETKDADWPKDIPDYPTKIGFIADPDQDYIRIQVYVTVAPAPTQEAKIKIDWSSLKYLNGQIDIESALDFSKLNKAVKDANTRKEVDYTSASWDVVKENLDAADAVIASSDATQTMADTRAEALTAAVKALVQVADDSDMEALDDALFDAQVADESDYSTNAWKELQSIISGAVQLKNASDVTPAMVTDKIKDLKAAVARTGGSDGKKDDTDNKDNTTTLKYSTLETMIKLLRSYSSSDYTELTYKQLQLALQSAEEVLSNAKAGKGTQTEIDNAVTLLKDAKSGLKTAEAKEAEVNSKALSALMTRANLLLAQKSSYTEDSIRTLQVEYDLAEAVIANSKSSQEEIDAELLSLKAAIVGLKAAGSSSTTNNSSTTDSSTKKETTSDDGYYKVKVQLWHANKNQASAGAACVSSPAYVHIDGSEITMRLVTKKMNKSGITAHLGDGDFYIYEDGSYNAASLISTEDSKWIHEFNLPNDTSTFYKCKVDPHVDVMGDEPVNARLKVTWSSKTKISETKWDNLQGDVDDTDDDDDTTTSTSKTTAAATTANSSTTNNGTTGNTSAANNVAGTAASGTAGNGTAAGTGALETADGAASGSNRSVSQTGSKSSAKSSKSSKSSSKTTDSASKKVTMIEGREIPYTGDRTPVKESAAMGIVSTMCAIWLAGGFSKKKRQ